MTELNLNHHISRKFNEELEAVRSKVLQMGGLVEKQLADALHALLNGDQALAKQVVENDRLVNNLEVEIDEECTRILARRQPAASDLRLVMAVIKTISDLERIGDEAERAGRMAETELRGVLSEEIRNEVDFMGQLVRQMLRQVLDAFARIDTDLAAEVIARDEKVDLKYNAITRQLITYMAEDPRTIPVVLKVQWAARSLERIGDRCQNVAEYIFYLVRGKDIRHRSDSESGV